MPTVIGYLDKSGAPAIKVQISGPLPNSSQEFEAIIDTGFSGFCSLPLLQAFPLGLILNGTTTVTFADGSTGAKLTALGGITAEGEHKVGVIILEQASTDVLLGMDFLKAFNKTLLVHEKNQLILLIDDANVEEVIKQALATAKTILSAPPSAQIASPAPNGTIQAPTPAEETFPEAAAEGAPAPTKPENSN